MKNEHTFHLPTLNETGDPSVIFFSDRYAQLVSGGRGYDKNCAVVIESDDYEILINLERPCDQVKHKALFRRLP